MTGERLFPSFGLSLLLKELSKTDDFSKSVLDLVTRAIDSIRDEHAVLGRHLRNSIQPGLIFRYDPERDEVVVTGDRLYVIKEALMTSSSFSASSGNMNMVVRMGAREEEDEEEEGEAAPLSVISYRLPVGY